MSNKLYRKLSKAVRVAAGCPGKPWCIVDVDGFTPPKVKGRAGHYTNKSGDPIHYPNAYRRAWGKPIYHASTIRIEVGRGWLIEQGLDEWFATRPLPPYLQKEEPFALESQPSPHIRFTPEGGWYYNNPSRN